MFYYQIHIIRSINLTSLCQWSIFFYHTILIMMTVRLGGRLDPVTPLCLWDFLHIIVFSFPILPSIGKLT